MYTYTVPRNTEKNLLTDKNNDTGLVDGTCDKPVTVEGSMDPQNFSNFRLPPIPPVSAASTRLEIRIARGYFSPGYRGYS